MQTTNTSGSNFSLWISHSFSLVTLLSMLLLLSHLCLWEDPQRSWRSNYKERINTSKGRLHRDWKSTEPFHSCTKGKNKMVLCCWFFAFVFVLGFFFVSLLFFFCFCFLLGKNSWTIATKHHGGLISWSFSWSNFSALPSKQATNIRVLRFCTECIVF